MVHIGEFNTLKIVRKADFGYFLNAETGNTSDDILLPNKSALNQDLKVGDEVKAFIYKDSKDRPIATLKEPLATVGEIAYLEVVALTRIGAFINIGLERDVLVPMKEQNYRLQQNQKYLFYLYLDKTDRLAATTFIDGYLDFSEDFAVGDEVKGTIYGFQTNGSAMVAVENKYFGVILRNEYFNKLTPGEEVTVRVKRFYEDGKMSLTPRKFAADERVGLEKTILDYLKEHDGSMPYNDKSSPEEIKEVFHSSKNYFKNALGGLMKQRLIVQDKTGTKLVK